MSHEAARRRRLLPSAIDPRQRNDQIDGYLQRARRKALLTRLRWQADRAGARINVDASLDIEIGRRVRIEVRPGTRNRLRVAPGVRLGDDVTIALWGGEVTLGPDVDIRRRCVLNVAGRLELAGGNFLSWGSTVHCADSVRFDEKAAASEYVTVTDSSHHFTEPDAFWYHNARASAVAIGFNSWLAAKSTVTRGVTIGRHCVVAANSVVIRDVPDGHLASGVPATIRALDLPWDTDLA